MPLSCAYTDAVARLNTARDSHSEPTESPRLGRQTWQRWRQNKKSRCTTMGVPANKSVKLTCNVHGVASPDDEASRQVSSPREVTPTSGNAKITVRDIVGRCFEKLSKAPRKLATDSERSRNPDNSVMVIPGRGRLAYSNRQMD